MLSKGPKFCVTTKGNFFDFKGSVRDFTKRLTLQEEYFDKTFNDKSLVRKASKKPVSTHNNDLKNIIGTLNRIEPMSIHKEDNISIDEKNALEELKKLSKENVEIKKADKTDVWVVMDKQEYCDKLVLKEHLDTPTYKQSTPDINKKVFKKLEKLISKNSSCLTKAEKNFVLDKEWREAHFYVLPKVNKCDELVEKMRIENKEYIEMNMPEELKSRPICGGPQAVTQGASKLLNEILSPLVRFQKSYIQDEWDFVAKLPSKVDRKYKLLSCDIKALYPSIPTELGLKALEYWIDKHGSEVINPKYTKEFILELSEFVLNNNFFEFDGKMFQQVIGTAMGSIFAPTYAQLTVGYLEETKLYPMILSKFDPETAKDIIEHFYRFMDDGTTLFPFNVDEEVFLNLINSMHPSLQYTMERAENVLVDGVLVQKLVFLSLIIYLDNNGNIWTDVHYKPTNTHDYLHFNSHHPDHIKKNIPHVLAKRILILTTKDDAIKKNLLDLKKWLKNCGYPDEAIDRGIHTSSIQGPAPNKTDKALPLINTYYSNYTNEAVTMVARQLIENSRNERIQKAFKNTKFVQALKQPPNLLRTLSNSTMIRKENTLTAGVEKCKDIRCKICRLYLQEVTSIEMANGFVWNIRCQANCNSMNIVYYLKCNFCNYTSYIGITDDTRDRTNNHISACRSGKSTDQFDNHVHTCGGLESLTKEEKKEKEPYFKLYIMMVCSSYNKLLSYEKKFHATGMDTMNK